jgi:hypothetical protein
MICLSTHRKAQLFHHRGSNETPSLALKALALIDLFLGFIVISAMLFYTAEKRRLEGKKPKELYHKDDSE